MWRFPYLHYFFEEVTLLFTLKDDKLKFIRINVDYIEALHDADQEVPYSTNRYENKPYIGLLISHDGHPYAIPLTSAKPKHVNWKDESKDRFLIYEMVGSEVDLGENAIIKPDKNQGSEVKHILSAIDLKKMIPVRSEVIQLVDFNPSISDDDETRKYKELLTKEFRFCIKIKQEILDRASELYDSIRGGKKIRFCCNFIHLETVSDNYVPKD